MRRAYDQAWPTEREDPAWYEARDLAQSADRAFLKNTLIRHAETALSSAARTAGKKIRSYSDEQKTVAFAGAALAIADIDPELAHRLLGPLRLALGDPYAYPVPSWADHP
ncbi:hypothetical protein [Streptomyces sp. NPDC059552]|uniref:hypothetical protein n=1 Tax=Streptomyces sp. NPDC059552 TaxID=3346862 RepID=UPI003679A2A8